MTENFARKGTGPISITGECNAMGNRWVGALSHLLPGMRLVANSIHRQEIADFWGIPVENIQDTPGHSILEIIRGLHTGDVKCLWVTTTNPAVSLPNTSWVKEGLLKADMLVVQDIYPNETSMLGDVILPAAQWCEKTGTYISAERRIELVEKLIEPPGEAKPDYEIIWLIARAMGFKEEFPYSSPEEVFNEYKKITKNRICDMNGVSYKRLQGKVGPQLPCPDMDHPGTPRLFLDLNFQRPDGRAALLARDYQEPAETIDDYYPMVLITGRLSGHFNTRTRTGRSPKLNAQAPDGYVEIHSKDSTALSISEGDMVKIVSRRGKVYLPARLTDSILAGTIFIPWHYGPTLGVDEGKSVNLVTNAVYDMHSKQPEYKFCAVNISKSEI
ncbi:molybdopterin oxidoreductase family protein [Desulfobacterales bacterium HSG17]|nr:molybdopterin oxidoreductase family protein [Desulfobacterales bacterium HSG17]